MNKNIEKYEKKFKNIIKTLKYLRNVNFIVRNFDFNCTIYNK